MTYGALRPYLPHDEPPGTWTIHPLRADRYPEPDYSQQRGHTTKPILVTHATFHIDEDAQQSIRDGRPKLPCASVVGQFEIKTDVPAVLPVGYRRVTYDPHSADEPAFRTPDRRACVGARKALCMSYDGRHLLFARSIEYA